MQMRRGQVVAAARSPRPSTTARARAARPGAARRGRGQRGGRRRRHPVDAEAGSTSCSTATSTDRDAGSGGAGAEGARRLPTGIRGAVPSRRTRSTRRGSSRRARAAAGRVAGIETIEDEKGFGSSESMETARYHHALEIELARTIATVQSVQNARVHLAMSRQSALLRNRQHRERFRARQPVSRPAPRSRSRLPRSRTWSRRASGPRGGARHDHRPDRPTAEFPERQRRTRSQRRRSSSTSTAWRKPTRAASSACSSRWWAWARSGAEVNAAVDFTEAEEVSESYGTERSALRSEQTAEDIKRGGMEAQGIPGALTEPAARGCARRRRRTRGPVRQHRPEPRATRRPQLRNRSALRDGPRATTRSIAC